jgi:hypothetical protein
VDVGTVSGRPFDALLRALAGSSLVDDADRHIWVAAADAANRTRIADGVRFIIIHDDFDPAMAVLDDFERWLDSQRDDLDSASSALDFVRAQLAAIRRHQDAIEDRVEAEAP